MSEVLEQVLAPLANRIASPEHDDGCYFCHASPGPTVETNDLSDEPDEDAAEMENSLGEYKFKNDAGKLGRALGGKPDPKRVTLNNGKTYDAAVAAHHLIPGIAALAHSALMTENLLGVDGKASGNIGYNVNAAPNGVWSPGNYGVRPWGTGGSEFERNGNGVTAQQFAFAAMDAWQCQFHDTHEAYSEFVVSVLNKIADKIKKNEELWCPEQRKNPNDSTRPLLSIVGRLNSVSARMRRMLTFPIARWHLNVYTSRFAEQYMLQNRNQVTQGVHITR